MGQRQPGLLRWYGKPLIGYAHGGYTPS